MGNEMIDVFIRILAQKDGSVDNVSKETKETVSGIWKDLGGVAQTAMVAFGAVAGAIGLVGQQIVSQAAEMEQYKAKLETVLKSSVEARETLRNAVEFAARTPFDVKGIIDASTTLTVYGAKAQQVLPLVADLAAGMGKDVKETALVMAKAWSGSAEGFEALGNTYGINRAKLREYGAAVNELGEISSRTSSDIEKNRAALEKIVKMEFGGAIDRQSRTFLGAFSNMQDAGSRFAVTLGERLIPLLTDVARGVTGAIEKFEKMPTIWKDLIVGGGLLAGAVSVLGLGFAGTVIVLAQYKEALEKLNAAKAKSVLLSGELAAAETAQAVAQKIAAGSSDSAKPEEGLKGEIKEVKEEIDSVGEHTKEFGEKIDEAKGILGKYSGLLERLPIYLQVAGVAYAGATYAINRYIEEQKYISLALEEEAKDFVKTCNSLRQYVSILNEAGKDQGIVVETTSNMAEQLRRIQEGVEKIDVVKLREVLAANGIQDNDIIQHKKELDEQLEREKKDRQALTALASSRTYRTEYEYAEGDTKREVPIGTKRVMDDKFDYKRLKGHVPDDIYARMEEFARKTTPEGIDGWLKSKDIKVGKAESEKAIVDPAAQAAEDLKKAFSDMETSSKALKGYLDLSDKVKGADAYIERLKMIKELTNNKSISLIEQGVLKTGSYQEALEKYKTTKNETEKAMLKSFLESKAEEIDAQKKADDERLRSGEKLIEKHFSSKKKAFEDEEALGKASAQKTLDRETALAEKLRAITQGTSVKKEVKMFFNGQGGKVQGMTTPEENELERMRKQYASDPEYKKKVDQELLELDKGNAAAKKSIQADNLAKMKQQNDLFLTAQRLAHKNDIAQEIADNNLLVKQFEEAAGKKTIAEKEAQAEITKLRQNTMTLTKQLQEQERDNALRYGAAQNASSSLSSKKYEKELKEGKDVQGAIIRESESRLQRELQMIDLKAQKEMEAAGKSATAQKAIMLEAENAKRAALGKEQDYISSMLQDTGTLEDRLAAISQKYAGNRIGGANSPLKSMEQAMEENSAIFEDGKKEAPKTEMQKYLASLEAQAKSTQDLSLSMTSLSDNIVMLAKAFGGDNSVARVNTPSPVEYSKNLQTARQQVVDQATTAQQSPGEALKAGTGKADFYQQLADKINGKAASAPGAVNAMFTFNGEPKTGDKELDDSAKRTADLALKFMTNNGHLNSGNNMFSDNFSNSGSIFAN